MAASGKQTNRTAIDLPTSVSSKIIQTAQEESAVMALAQKIDLPGNGLTIPVILGDPEPGWVEETDKKPVSNPQLGTKQLKGYTLAVIVPFSNQFRRDNTTLYNALIGRLPRALGKKFDNTVFGGTQVPGELFTSLAGATGVDITASPYTGLVQVDMNIALAGGILNSYVLSPQGKGILLSTTDEMGRPLFINSVAEGAIPMILSNPVKLSKGAYIEGTPATEAEGTEGQEGYVPASDGTPSTVGFAGDWTHAMYGVVESLKASISDQASITVNGEVLNLWERNMFAVRAEMEIGFTADVTKFNRLLGTVPTAS